jgi:hypothetical protein
MGLSAKGIFLTVSDIILCYNGGQAKSRAELTRTVYGAGAAGARCILRSIDS